MCEFDRRYLPPPPPWAAHEDALRIWFQQCKDAQSAAQQTMLYEIQVMQANEKQMELEAAAYFRNSWDPCELLRSPLNKMLSTRRIK